MDDKNQLRIEIIKRIEHIVLNGTHIITANMKHLDKKTMCEYNCEIMKQLHELLVIKLNLKNNKTPLAAFNDVLYDITNIEKTFEYLKEKSIEYYPETEIVEISIV